MAAIASIFAQITFYITWLNVRVALKIFAIGIGAALLTALYFTASAKVGELVRVVPGELLVLWGHFAPDNALPCLAAIIFVRIAAAATAWVMVTVRELSSSV